LHHHHDHLPAALARRWSTDRADFVRGSQLESQVSLEEYSVSNRGLRAGLIGTPEQITDRLRAYEQVGVDLVLLQFSPQQEEMARFGRDVISCYPGGR
jgi:FMNH2-dependent dimethyl sulfone monooxygenase